MNTVKTDLKDQLPSVLSYLQRIKEDDPENIHTQWSENHFAEALSRLPQVTSMHLRRYESDSDYEEMLNSELEAEEELQYESVNDDQEVVGKIVIKGSQLRHSREINLPS